MTTRVCRTCNVEKPISEYRIHKTYKDGIDTKCAECLRLYRREKWAQNQERYQGYSKAYKDKNKEIISKRNKKYVIENKEKRAETSRKYRLKTKDKQSEYVRRRQSSKLQRTPLWLTEDDIWMMREAYALAKLRAEMFGFSWHVDHIIPLQGKLASGLHVPLNLQVIPWHENLAKHNRYEVTN